MSEIYSRIIIAFGLVGLGQYVMNVNNVDSWGAMGLWFLGLTFSIVGGWSIGLDVGRLMEGKRR